MIEDLMWYSTYSTCLTNMCCPDGQGSWIDSTAGSKGWQDRAEDWIRLPVLEEAAGALVTHSSHSCLLSPVLADFNPYKQHPHEVAVDQDHGEIKIL